MNSFKGFSWLKKNIDGLHRQKAGLKVITSLAAQKESRKGLKDVGV